jgi:DNA-binding HxlR family transcriptional regulator
MTAVNKDPDVLPAEAQRAPTSEYARAVLDHVTSRWSIEVLCALSRSPHRWGELRRIVQGVSEKMLASTLKTLESDGLVRRDVLSLSPPHVEYSLSSRGRDGLQRLLPLVRWVADHDEASSREP